MKRAVVLALTALCALLLIAVPAQGKAKKAQTTRPRRAGVCVVVVKQENGTRRTVPQGRGVRRSPRCRGPRGLRGPRGATGPRGERGAEGRDGANGTNGRNGTNGANGAPGPAGPKGDQGAPGTAWAGTRYAVARDAVTTPSTTFEPLGGPVVTVTVPESGTIMVAAQSLSDGGDGSVSLFEDGVQLAGQNDFCNGPAGTLFDTLGMYGPPIAYGTPGSLNIGLEGCATSGPPGPVLFQTSPGVHRYELRYSIAACGCGGGEPATFSERKLWVTPLP